MTTTTSTSEATQGTTTHSTTPHGTTPVHVRAFAAARAALGAPELTVDVPVPGVVADGADAAGDAAGRPTVGHVLAAVRAQAPAAAEVVARCSVLVDGTRADASAPVPTGAVVDLLPPFAGG